MGILINDGDSKPVNLANYAVSFEKAKSVKNGDMVSWQSSGGTATGRVEHIMREGVLGIPKSSFSIKAEKDDPAVLIRIYKDGKETETLVGHKMSTLRKSESVEKHGSHDQSSHGAWANGKYNPDDSEGEDEIEPKNYRTPQKLSELKDDSEGEFEDSNYDDPRHMDDMDILRPFGGNAFANTWRKSSQAVSKDPEAMMRDYDKMEANWRKKLNSKPYDPANPELGDPQDLASTDFYRKYGIYPDQVPM